jgi:CDP-diacylglycerol--glycerol-3-phosphate 3-phosphatidyltransferase
MGIYATKSRWQKLLDPLVRASVRARLHPDLFIYAALLASLAAGALYALAPAFPAGLWFIPALLILRLGLNLMDGMVARALGIADSWGEVKNEFGDRLADAAIFGGLALGGYSDLRLAAAALILILLCSYLGILNKALGRARLYRGLFGKGDRMLSLAAFTLYPALTGRLAAFDLYLWFALLAAVVTILQRLNFIHDDTQSAG